MTVAEFRRFADATRIWRLYRNAKEAYRRLRWMRSVSRDESPDQARNVNSAEPMCRTSPSFSACGAAIGFLRTDVPLVLFRSSSTT